ncbi:MAG: 3-oxoacyl-ACP reductase family protein [Candidatus Thermoplasmatota archaeon]
MELKGRKAIVTGGSIGIGAAIALAFGKEGADVAINYRRHDTEANEVVKKICALGSKALAVKADVASLKDAENMVSNVLKNFGGLDILVCNAGITRDAVIWKMTEQQWDEVITTNLKGYFNYIKAVAPIFKDQRYGKIINITSINALRGKFGQANYSASKAGIVALTKTVAKELGKFNVNVNAVAPGMVETEMSANIPAEFLQKAIDETVIGRIATADDIANVVVFLASEKARHITGEVIKVDGGQYI